jgi:hypothetical protein
MVHKKNNLIIFSILVMMMVCFSTSSASAVTVYGVTTTNQLVRFDTATPGTVATVGAITGLQNGENVLGMDFRPATGQLYALGSTSRLYVINTATGAATAVGSAPFTPALNGTDFGFDFNPTVDRIRVVSDADQNLRLNPETGGVAATDINLAFATSDPNQAANPNATGSAYTMNFNGATTTMLYNIDSNLDILVTQNPPNNGTLNTVGALGVNTSGVLGFDFTQATNTAYAALNVGGTTGLYTINLTTGAATLVANVGGGNVLRDIALEIAGVPGYLAFGLTATNNLIRFNTARPNTIISTTAVTGLQAGENLLGIDFRPATGQLFGLGSTSRLYSINTQTGATTVVGTMLTTTLSGTDFGFDFNPVPDRIRIVNDADQNLRANPNDGTNLVDGVLAYATGDANAGQNPTVTGAAYINSFGGATTTTLYDIDSNLDILATQNPPNNGTLNTVGSLGVNTTSQVGFDIATGSNTAFAAFQISGETSSKLFAVNLTTGAASIVGPIGSAEVIRDIAVTFRTVVDFDGDRKTDYSVFRLSENAWYILNSSNQSTFRRQTWGLAQSDTLTPADYDGDGRMDIAVWRRTDGVFYIIRSSDNTFQFTPFGLDGDEPVVRDYDGDGRADLTQVRRTGGQLFWHILRSATNAYTVTQFGLESDIIAPGDYDGDGRYDLAVRRGNKGENATFFIQQSTLGFRALQFGFGQDFIVPGDYDGDGKTDIAAYRVGSLNQWFVLRSSDGTLTGIQLGAGNNHLATQGDYDGDGKTDFSVWDQISGRFFTLRSSNGMLDQVQWGVNGDVPIANQDVH